MERIDFKGATSTWRSISTTRKDGTITEQWQVTVRYRVPTGEINHKGQPVTIAKRRSKLFPPNAKLETERKRRNAAAKFIDQLDRENEQAVTLSEQRAREEEERQEREREELAKLSAPANKLVGDYVSDYLDSIEHSIERVTIGNYRTTAKRLREAFPRVALRDLTTDKIQRWEKELIDSGLAPATVIKYHRVLSEACRSAVHNGHLVRNPCEGVKMPKRVAPSPNSLTVDGFSRLTATLTSLQPSSTVTAALMALHTGMREGEVCGLRWKCYDQASRTINVEESIGKAKGGTYSKAPKTKASKRDVPVSKELATMLERRRRLMTEELEVAGVALDDGEFGELYVIGTVDMRYQSPTALSRAWKEMSRSFGLVGTQGRAITFHDLRHSFATVAIATGADVKSVASILGHASAQLTLNTYADADPQSKRRTVDSLPSGRDSEPLAESAER